MKQGIQTYILLFVLTLSVLVITQLSGLVIRFKELSEVGMLAVEIIEVSDGVNDKTLLDLVKIQEEYQSFEIDYRRIDYDKDYHYYEIKVQNDFRIAALNYSYPIISKFNTKRLNTR